MAAKLKRPSLAIPLALWGAAAFAYFWLSFRFPLALTGDQKAYLTIALEMRERGEWLTPFLWGEPNYLKPPLHYWLTLASWKLFGFGWWQSLLPSWLAAFAAAECLRRILLGFLPATQRDDDRAFGVDVAAAGALLATLGTAVFANSAQMETELVFFSLTAWAAALRGLRDLPGRRRWYWTWLAFGLAGVGGLAKSPLYSAFWVIGYGAYLLLAGEWRELRRARFWSGLFFGITVGIAWFVWIYVQDGERFLAQYWTQESVSKRGGNASEPYGIWLALLYWALPWTLLALGALVRRLSGGARVALGENAEQARRFWAWLVAFAIPAAAFFTLYPYRVNTYLYPLVPAAVALAFRPELFSAALARVSSAVLAFLTFAMAFLLGPPGFGLVDFPLVALWAGIGALALLYALAGGALLGGARAAGLLALVFLGLSSVAAFRLSAATIGEKDLAGFRVALERMGDERGLALYEEDRNVWAERGLLAALAGRSVTRATSYAEIEAALRAGRAVILNEAQDARMGAAIRRRLREQGVDYGEQAWKRFETRARLALRSWLLSIASRAVGRYEPTAAPPPVEEWLTRKYVVIWEVKR